MTWVPERLKGCSGATSALVTDALIADREWLVAGWAYSKEFAYMNVSQATLAVRRGLLMRLVAALAVTSLAAGCATVAESPHCPGADPNMADNVTLCPGASAVCSLTPCAVKWTMPSGVSGTYEIIVNELHAGTAEGDTAVSLGSYWPGDYAFSVKDHKEFPSAYLTVSDKF